MNPQIDTPDANPAPPPGIKYRALAALLRWFSRMRPASRQRAGRILGWLAATLARRRARIVRRNLELCFPNESAATRARWAKQHFRALGQSIVDRGVLWYGEPEAIRDMIALEGLHNITDLLDQGRTVIMLAPHFIALDATATRLTMEGSEGASMYTPQSDPDIDRLVREGRTRFNRIFLVNRRDGPREMVRHLRAGRPLYYLPDMDFGRNGSAFVPFFGVPAATLLATAQIAQKWQAAVVPVIGLWHADTGKYTVQVLPAMENFPGNDSLEDATARLNRELETWIQRDPSQYYWVHRRFKTRPEGEKSLYL